MEKYYNDRALVAGHGAVNTEIASKRANWDMNYLKLKEIYNKLVSA